VRYLRNALMAKIGGEGSDLLQISADERARAGRSAMLFGEEDLTRFLQVMLRTFDDLNYRQEQRFHLELGLVKLVHLQRLLPVEELLSGMQGTGGQSAGGRERGASGAQVRVAGEVRATSLVRPSPFEVDRNRKVSGESAAGTVSAAVSVSRALSPAEAVGRTTAEAKPAAMVGLAEPESATTEGALALAPDAAPDPERIRDAVCAALAREGHETAAEALHLAVWSMQGNALRVVVPMRKSMLTLTVNTEAEAICRKAARAAGATQKILFEPGENGSASGPAPAPLAGDVQQAAMENPLVRKTQELFQAEIRSVLDLRESN
jgi:DNA polymerase III subunit gamma/tau